MSLDALVKRNSEILCMEAVKRRDVINLQNWVNGTGCITRSEMDYLHTSPDLMAVGASTTDGALGQLQNPVEDAAKWLLTRFHCLEKLVSNSHNNLHMAWRVLTKRTRDYDARSPKTIGSLSCRTVGQVQLVDQ
jgi:hypothetical protein